MQDVRGDVTGLGRDDKGQRDDATTNQINKKLWLVVGLFLTRRFLAPPMGTPCRMTVMEMRWAKLMPKSDCLISSDVHGYLYFDLVRYMKCTFSLSLAFGRFLHGLFLYRK